MSWGNKLLVTFIVFVAGMMYLVFRSMNTNYELVEKDYYKNELRYQEVIDGMKSSNALKTPLQIGQQEDGSIALQLPDEMKNATVSGEVWFYCAYDSKKDKKFDLKPGIDGVQHFKISAVDPGNYTVRVSWTDAGTKYYTEKPLNVL
ncbi:MAG TPA: FixH family protein [Chitinophagaceae bacterium]|nr:FixH family protein [Chitinophagaceae bacterium]